VGVPWLYSACGHCEFCLAAREPVCAEAQFGGYTRNGGFAEYILADPNYVAHIPAGLAAVDAAPLICAGITSYKGLKETQARPGRVGGHLGHRWPRPPGRAVRARPWACRCARSTSTTASSPTPGGWAQMRWSTPAPATRWPRCAHGVLITAPSLPAFKQGVGMTRKHGTCVLVGIPPGDFPTPLFDVVANCITIRGSFVGNRRDMAEALAFAANGTVKADIELQPLSAVNAVFERLAKGDVPSRVVLDFAG
jgi:propanol-preferring alcohol dehydrogenase